MKVDLTGMFRWKNDMSEFYYRGFLVGGYYSVTPWLDLGGHYWFKEVRKTVHSDWIESNTFLVRVNFKHKVAEWCTLQEANRIEYNTSIDRWRLRVKPKAEFPLRWLGLDWLKLFVDNEFFFAFDYQDDRDTYSQNRTTVGGDVKIAGPAGVTVAYRNEGKKPAATDNWDFTNVLVTYIKLGF